MKQNQGESMDSFHMRVKDKVESIKLQDKSAAEIVELLTLAQLVNCTNDVVLCTKALRDPKLKLRTFIDSAMAHEMANRQASEISVTGNSDTLEVKKVKKTTRFQKRQLKYNPSEMSDMVNQRNQHVVIVAMLLTQEINVEQGMPFVTSAN